MNIIDGNIILRAIEKKDNDVLKCLVNDPDIEKKIGGWSFPVSDENQESWYKSVSNYSGNDHVRFAIDVDDKCVGMAALHGIDYKNSNASIDIKIVKDEQGKGVGYRVISMLKQYAFEELNLNMLVSEVIVGNESSRKVFEKAGFSLDGILRNRLYKNGMYHGQCMYSIMRDEYFESKRQ